MALLQLKTSVFVQKICHLGDFSSVEETPHLELRGDVPVHSKSGPVPLARKNKILRFLEMSAFSVGLKMVHIVSYLTFGRDVAFFVKFWASLLFFALSLSLHLGCSLSFFTRELSTVLILAYVPALPCHNSNFSKISNKCYQTCERYNSLVGNSTLLVFLYFLVKRGKQDGTHGGGAHSTLKSRNNF